MTKDDWSQYSEMNSRFGFNDVPKGPSDAGLYIVVALGLTMAVFLFIIIMFSNVAVEDTSYHEVSKDYSVEYIWTNTMAYYQIEFYSNNEGYMILDFGSSPEYYQTDMLYHSGHNRYLIPCDELLKNRPRITFYER